MIIWILNENNKFDSCNKSDKYLKHYVECNKIYVLYVNFISKEKHLTVVNCMHAEMFRGE